LNGRKRHVLVDTLGLLLEVVVLPAHIADRNAAPRLLESLKSRFPSVSLIWGDQGYVGPALARWMEQTLGCQLVLTKNLSQGHWLMPGQNAAAFLPAHVEPRRWVVERTFAWMGRNRRLSKDYEGLPETEEALCYLGMVHLMLKRLTK
jgi:putative transposase